MKTQLEQNLNNNYYNPKNLKQNGNNPSFKGITAAVNGVSKFLADEPVWGATGVDIGSMVIPRTWTDVKKRGAVAGFETGFREAESSANDALIGVYGVAAGSLIAGALNNKYNVTAHKIFASDDAASVYSAKWEKHNGNVSEFAKDIVDNLEAYNPNSKHANAEGFVKIPEEHKQGIIDDLKYVAEGDRNGMPDRWKEVKKRLSAKLLEATGTEQEFRLVHNDGAAKKVTVANSKTMFENFYRLSEALKSDKVKGKVGEFVKSYKGFGKTRTAIGIAIAGVFAVIAQPLNVYISKKRTGTDGFVGVEGRKKDNSKSFKMLKLASGVGMMTIALASMGALAKNPLKIPKLFIEKNQYKGKSPTINQFKTVFGLAISSRLLAARDKDEHREVVTKDVLGFFNWLILGKVVNQLILHKFQAKGANLLKRAPLPQNPTRLQKIGNFLSSSIATHSEVVVDGLRKERPDIKSIIKPNGQAMKFNEMLKLLPKGGQARKNLRLLNIAQWSGYVYSALVLGKGIPNLNIYLTNLSEKHKRAKMAMVHQNSQAAGDKIAINKQVENTAFSQIKTH